MKECVICGKPITYTFWVCRGCEEDWDLVGVDYKDWPEWVKSLVSIDRRRVYVENQMNIVYVEDLEEFLDYHEDARVLS